MFGKIAYTNTKGEKKERIVNFDYIQSIGEKTIAPVDLYDENGNFVKTDTPTEKVYYVRVENHCELLIDQEQYDSLVALLLK